MSGVGGVGGAGGGGAAAPASGGVGGVASGGSGSSGGVAEVGSSPAVGDSEAAKPQCDSSSDTKAVEQTGYPMQGPQMSTQDFCSLRNQAVQPVQESQEIDLQKMLEWLMAIKLLEAMNKDGG